MTANLSLQDVLKALSSVNDPDLNRDIVSLGFVKNLEVGDNRVSFTIHFPTPVSTIKQQLGATAKRAVEQLGVADVQVRVTSGPTGPAASRTMPGQAPGVAAAAAARPNFIPQVKNTVA